jgi:hypothetical protein
LVIPPDPPTITIYSTQGPHRDLLRLHVVDGVIQADYDPIDLTEAAQVFVAEVCRISCGSGAQEATDGR